MAKKTASEAVMRLRRQWHEMECARHPGIRPSLIPETKWDDTTANGLTACIIAFCSLCGWQAERISSTGRWLDKRQIVTDCTGNRRTIGSGCWIKPNTTIGTADISATINGRSVKIEVKIGRDRQSDRQKQYKAQIERAGGIYIIARSLEQFVGELMTYSSRLGITGCGECTNG